jgi:hypothetical protein
MINLSKSFLTSLLGLLAFFTLPVLAQSIPTAEELYIRGQFLVKPSYFWSENHYGEPMDLSIRRPVVNLAETVFAKKYGKPGTTLIANVFHKGRFYVARVPSAGVANIYFQRAYFPPKILNRFIAAHSLIRIEMNTETPIELVAEMPSEAEVDSWKAFSPEEVVARFSNPLSQTLHNVVISAEGSWTQVDRTKRYSLVRGLNGAYLQVVRIVSMEERFIEFYKSGNPVAQTLMEPEDQNLTKGLNVGIQMSERDGLKKIYNTLFYNCTTMAFDILQTAFKLRDDRLGYIRSFMQKRIPIIAPLKLAYFGGIEVDPIDMDPSLAAEAKAARERIDCENALVAAQTNLFSLSLIE